MATRSLAPLCTMKLLCIHCTAAKSQAMDHIGVSNVIHRQGFLDYQSAHCWLQVYGHHPYIEVTATLTEITTTEAGESQTGKFVTLFKKDE